MTSATRPVLFESGGRLVTETENFYLRIYYMW